MLWSPAVILARAEPPNVSVAKVFDWLALSGPKVITGVPVLHDSCWPPVPTEVGSRQTRNCAKSLPRSGSRVRV